MKAYRQRIWGAVALLVLGAAPLACGDSQSGGSGGSGNAAGAGNPGTGGGSGGSASPDAVPSGSGGYRPEAADAYSPGTTPPDGPGPDAAAGTPPPDARGSDEGTRPDLPPSEAEVGRT